jgi:hypothetical protein
MKPTTRNDPVARLTNDAVSCGVPFFGAQTLAHYIVNKIPPGGFLESFLANDLMEALGRADSTNINLFPAYGKFLYNYAPRACHGSYEIVQSWLNQGKEVDSETGCPLF